MYPGAPTLDGQMQRILEVFWRILPPEAHRLRVGFLTAAIWQRVRKLGGRFCALYGMWKAGTLPKPRVRAVAHPPPRPCTARGEGEAIDYINAGRVRPASVLPRALGWMYKMVPWSAGSLAGGVDSIMRNFPEMQAFAAACPQVGRVVRPLCRMTGIKPPEYLQLPRRGRRSSPRLVRFAAQSPRGGEGEAPPPRPSPASAGEGEGRRVRARDDCAVVHPSPVPSVGPHRACAMGTPIKGRGTCGEGGGRRKRRTPREVAAAAIAKSLRTGKPVDPRKIGAVAFGYVLHWPRDDNCPPPEIGYGGRMFPPLPKNYVRPRDRD